MSTSIYSSDRIAALTSAQPLNWAKCKQFASEWGTTPRSIQAKAISLGMEYVKLSPVKREPKAKGPTKADYIRDIRAALALPEREGDFTKFEVERILEHIA